MLRSGWFSIARALGLVFLTLCVLAFVFFWGATLGTKSGYYRAQSQGYASQYPHDTDQRLEQCFTKPDVVAARSCAQEAISADRENQRGEYDLQAQRETADWTFYAVVVALLQIPVGIFGLVALIVTIKQGQEAINKAREANEIAQRQQIAELLINGVNIWIRNSFNAEITAKNIGNITAKNITIKARAELTYKVPTTDIRFPFSTKSFGLGEATSEQSVIHFGQNAVVLEAGFFLEPSLITLSEIRNATSVKHGLHVLITGQLEWSSSTGKREAIGFHIFCNDGKVDDDGVVWIACSRISHHEIDSQG